MTPRIAALPRHLRRRFRFCIRCGAGLTPTDHHWGDHRCQPCREKALDWDDGAQAATDS